MEFNPYKAFNQHPKLIKLTNHAQFCSTSIQDSIFKPPFYLPPELINGILLKLPVKSLVKFRSVSKSWLALISSKEFISTHLRLSANDKDYKHHRLMLRFDPPYYSLQDCSFSSLLFNDSVTQAFDLDCRVKSSSMSVTIAGSVNGLVCLVIGEKYLFLWNPSIRKFKYFPDCRATTMVNSCFMYGFGYDEIHDDYKVVAGFRCSGFLKVDIYSVNSGSWKSVDDFPDSMVSMKSGVLVNGKLHWCNTAYQTIPSFDTRGIISINLADGKWGKVEQPCYREGNFDLTLGVLGSDLSVFCNYQRIHADVWVLKEYGVNESWTKAYTLKYPNWFYSPFVSPTLCMSNSGDVFVVPGSNLTVHNLEDEPVIYPKAANSSFYVAVNIYIESLVCPSLPEEQTIDQEGRMQML